MARVVDYSYARVDGRNETHALAISEAGFEGALRYLCWPQSGDEGGRGKRLTPSECRALWERGLKIGLVWETTADRAGKGFQAGHVDAVEANRQADALGFPNWVPIYYAVDFDADPGTVRPYFDGVASTAGANPFGVYGSYRVVEGLHDMTPWIWQCAAWSGTGAGSGGSLQGRRLSQYACLYQYVGYVLRDTCDVNEVLKPWGGYLPGDANPSQEDDVTPEQMAQLGTWMQEQAKVVNDHTDAKIDALAWGVVAGNVKVIQALTEEIRKQTGGEVNLDADALSAQVSGAVLDEMAKRLDA